MQIGQHSSDWTWRAVSSRIDLEGRAHSEQGALDSADAALMDWISSHGVAWIRAYAGNDFEQHCPQTTMRFPSDNRHCKATNEICPLGGIVSRRNTLESLEHCNAPHRVKAGVVQAIRAGYAGLHHHSGTYFCAACSDEESWGHSMRAVRFPFELQILRDIVDLENPEVEFETKRELIVRGLNTHVLFAGHCSECLLQVAQQLSLPEASGLRIRKHTFVTRY